MPGSEPICVEDEYKDHTLLVVDDNAANLAVIVDFLGACGFQMIVARTGETALALAQSEQPDLILLDVMLPGIDGFETCRRLMENEATRHIMVIFMTVLTETGHKIKGFDLGAVDYITKPFQQDELLARVSTHLKLKDLTENLEHKVRSQTRALITANRKLHQQVSESRKIEMALRESEGRYRAAIENSNDGIAIIEKGYITYINPMLLKILAYERKEELIGKPVGELFHPDERERVTRYNQLREAGRSVPARYEAKGIDKNGRPVYLDISATRITYQDQVATLGFFMDITQRKHLESQLRQASKMEAIGTLAGGIAHDFNNILSIIIGSNELALMDQNIQPGTQNHLRQALSAGHRAAELVQQILTFSRQKDVDRRPVRLSHLVQETLKMIRASLPSTIDIHPQINDCRSKIMADATQIHQVLMNLCTNAAQAMPGQGGILEVALRQVDLDQTSTGRLKPGPYLKLSVSDNGCGMDGQTLERIFDPYFSTKKPGEGTGLGLAVVHGIVTSYGGDIQVRSQPGKGTCFEIMLPVTRPRDKVEEINTRLGGLPTGSEHILFVDDEKLMVNLYDGLLRHLGYTVTATDRSEDAWQLFKSQPDRFDLVITDITMPGITGNELSKKILAFRPDMPVIVFTGYSNLLNQEQADAMGIRKYLMKPLVVEQLAHAIREVLDN